MVKIAVLGDTESIKGFAAVGLDIFPCDDALKVQELFKSIVNSGYGVIYITEALCAPLEKQIAEADKRLTPSVVPIKGAYGNTGIGTERLKDAVIKAVGSDIIFNKD